MNPVMADTWLPSAPPRTRPHGIWSAESRLAHSSERLVNMPQYLPEIDLAPIRFLVIVMPALGAHLDKFSEHGAFGLGLENRAEGCGIKGLIYDSLFSIDLVLQRRPHRAASFEHSSVTPPSQNQ